MRRLSVLLLAVFLLLSLGGAGFVRAQAMPPCAPLGDYPNLQDFQRRLPACPLGSKEDNACNAGGSLAGRCDNEAAWSAGWYVARAEFLRTYTGVAGPIPAPFGGSSSPALSAPASGGNVVCFYDPRPEGNFAVSWSVGAGQVTIALLTGVRDTYTGLGGTGALQLTLTPAQLPATIQVLDANSLVILAATECR